MSRVPDELRELVEANRIIGREAVVDAFGHISVRHPERPDRFFMARARAPELVELDDLMEFDVEGHPIEEPQLAMNAERMIHAAVYEARPDARAVCHNHARALIPFGHNGVPIRPLFHMGCVVGTEVPVWDIAQDFGPSDLMVDTMDRGRSLARTLGSRRAALMRGHGAVVAANSIREAVMVSVYLHQNAEMQLQLLASGAPGPYLSDAEIEKAAERQLHPGPIAKAWEYWRARAYLPAR